MSYPKNKYQRLLISKCKGRKRVSSFGQGFSAEWKKETTRLLRNTTKICSAVGCCGNPRRRGELTQQEKRFLSSLKD